MSWWEMALHLYLTTILLKFENFIFELYQCLQGYEDILCCKEVLNTFILWISLKGLA